MASSAQGKSEEYLPMTGSNLLMSLSHSSPFDNLGFVVRVNLGFRSFKSCCWPSILQRVSLALVLLLHHPMDMQEWTRKEGDVPGGWHFGAFIPSKTGGNSWIAGPGIPVVRHQSFRPWNKTNIIRLVFFHVQVLGSSKAQHSQSRIC